MSINSFHFSAEFLLKVLGLINSQNSVTVDRCPPAFKCVPKSRFVTAGSGLALICQNSIRRCSFLGTLDTKRSNNSQEPKLSKLLETLRPQLTSCPGPSGRERRSRDHVCCKAQSSPDTSLRKPKPRLELLKDENDYEDSEYDIYDEEYGDSREYDNDNEEGDEYDLNFDKVLIYSHRNAPGGR